MKLFDLERAKAGDPVVTRGGYKARIICFDRNDKYPMIALISAREHPEVVSYYDLQGKNTSTGNFDLFMAPKKVQHWANVYRSVRTGAIDVGHIWASEAKAIENIDENIDIKKYIRKKYIRTILLHEEEI